MPVPASRQWDSAVWVGSLLLLPDFGSAGWAAQTGRKKKAKNAPSTGISVHPRGLGAITAEPMKQRESREALDLNITSCKPAGTSFFYRGGAAALRRCTAKQTSKRPWLWWGVLDFSSSQDISTSLACLPSTYPHTALTPHGSGKKGRTHS